jgi:soluble lytic murein transglycosylase-like protein
MEKNHINSGVISKKHIIREILIIGLTLSVIGLAVFFAIKQQKEKEKLISILVQKDSTISRMNALINWSVYYTNMAKVAWGINAGSCDVGLIQNIEKTIKETGADSFGVDVPLVLSVIVIESGFNRNVVSSAGAVGIMQLMPSTAKMHVKEITAEDLYDETVNIKAGILELKRLMKAFDGDKELALLAYNRGERRVKTLLSQNISPRNKYSEKVLRIYFYQ